MARPPRNALTLPRLIVCEGAADEAFLRALIQQRGLPALSIRHPGDLDTGGRGGIDKLGWLLAGIRAWNGFTAVTDLLIVADNDTDPDGNFARVGQQLANAGYPVPAAPLAAAEAPNQPRVCVLMLPWTNEQGTLDALCLGPARAAAPGIASCVDAFAACVQASGQDHAQRQAAMALRVLLAGAHAKNPGIGLGRVWQDNPALIPLDHAAFDRVARVLADFATG